MRLLADHAAKRGRGLDARAVLLSVLALILGVKALHTPQQLGVAAGVVAFLVVLLGIPWVAFLRRSLWALPFSLAALPLVFTVPGPPLFAVLGLSGSVTGAERFLAIAAQCLLCVQLILVAGSVCGPFELVTALGRLGCPRRMVAVLSLCLRYLDLLADELSRLQRARLSRGGREPGLAFRARITGQLVGTLFLRSLSRAERVEVAMRSRGGTGGSLAGAWQPVCRWRAGDSVVLLLAVGLAALAWTFS